MSEHSLTEHLNDVLCSAVEKILKRDISSVNELMKGEFNALHIAVTNDHVECARLLLAEVLSCYCLEKLFIYYSLVALTAIYK